MAAAPGVRRSELGDALRACRNAFIGVGLMSCMINLLYLTGSIFMLEVYDRVLPSRSIPTLVGLVILAGGLYVAQGILDLIRGRVLVRIGTSLDEALNARVFDTVVRLPLMVGGRSCGRSIRFSMRAIRPWPTPPGGMPAAGVPAWSIPVPPRCKAPAASRPMFSRILSPRCPGGPRRCRLKFHHCTPIKSLVSFRIRLLSP